MVSCESGAGHTRTVGRNRERYLILWGVLWACRECPGRFLWTTRLKIQIRLRRRSEIWLQEHLVFTYTATKKEKRKSTFWIEKFNLILSHMYDEKEQRTEKHSWQKPGGQRRRRRFSPQLQSRLCSPSLVLGHVDDGSSAADGCSGLEGGDDNRDWLLLLLLLLMLLMLLLLLLESLLKTGDWLVPVLWMGLEVRSSPGCFFWMSAGQRESVWTVDHLNLSPLTGHHSRSTAPHLLHHCIHTSPLVSSSYLAAASPTSPPHLSNLISTLLHPDCPSGLTRSLHISEDLSIFVLIFISSTCSVTNQHSHSSPSTPPWLHPHLHFEWFWYWTSRCHHWDPHSWQWTE